MADSMIWWIASGLAVIVELVTMTFYLLMLAIGLAAGAIAAHLGASLTVQLLTVALVSSGTVGAWHLYRSRSPREAHASANRDVNLDIGELVQVDAWNADGTATVKYRGANWTVLTGSGEHATGKHRVTQVTGNRLVVEKV